MPVRKIPKRYRSVTGTFPVKNKRNIFYESLLERDFYFLLLNLMIGIISYETTLLKFTIKEPNLHIDIL